MPLTGIIFPSGKQYSLDDIMAGNIGEPLPAPLNYLKAMFRNREWDGTVHVTDLLKGTRQAYLTYTHPYSQTADQAAYSFMGTNTHATLEDIGSEVPFVYNGVQGTVDLLEENDDGALTLTDIKNQGSYAVAKALGIYSEDEMVLDEQGNPVIYKSGKKAGEYKTRKIYKQDPDKADLGDTRMQISIYQFLLNELLNDFDPVGKIERHLGHDPKGTKWERVFHFVGKFINTTKVFYIVRDGGTQAAMSRGVKRRTYYLDVEPFSPPKVERFIGDRRQALQMAIEDDQMPEPCTEEEAWGGRRCASYCPVAKWCVMNGDNPYITIGDITW